MDYRHYTILEAAQIQLATDFIETIRRLDKEVAIRRLSALLRQNPTDVVFYSVVGHFLTLASHATTED